MTTKPDEFAAKVALGEAEEFSAEEREALRDFARFWLGMQAVGRAAVVLQSVVKYIGWGVALYIAVKAGLVEWIKGALR
jgi:hypothetical protein